VVDELACGSERVEAVGGPAGTFSAGVEEVVGQIGGVRDEYGHQVASIKQPVWIHRGGDDLGGGDAGPADGFAGPGFQKGARLTDP
jgi:hypothetical protein